MIESYTYEPGVRKLKEKVFEILRELNLRYLTYGSSRNKILKSPMKLLKKYLKVNPNIQ